MLFLVASVINITRNNCNLMNNVGNVTTPEDKSREILVHTPLGTYLNNEKIFLRLYGIRASADLVFTNGRVLINAKNFDPYTLINIREIKRNKEHPKKLTKKLFEDLSFTKFIDFLKLFGNDVFDENKNTFLKNLKSFFKNVLDENDYKTIISDIIKEYSDEEVFQYLYKYSLYTEMFFIKYNGIGCKVLNERNSDITGNDSLGERISFTIFKIHEEPLESINNAESSNYNRLLIFLENFQELALKDDVKLNFTVKTTRDGTNKDEKEYGQRFIERIKSIIKQQNNENLGNNYKSVSVDEKENMDEYIQFDLSDDEGSDDDFSIKVE